MEDKIDKFCEYFYKHFTEGTWYLHFFWIHVPQWIKFWYPVIQCGYGIFTTQGSEHKNKFIKKGIFHSQQRNNYLKNVVKKLQLKKFHFMNYEKKQKDK